MKNNFNYIIPIFNKEDILLQTLEGVENCSGAESKIIMIVDGCTDNSETIVDEFMKNSSRKTEKILMPNVHMLLSVNAGLKTVQSGFSIVMQDDIILQDVDMETKIVDLYSEIENLGMISFRYGSDIRACSRLTRLKRLYFKPMIEEFSYIKGPDDIAPFEQANYGVFYPKMNAINGPNCIPYSLLAQLKGFDENLAPYGYDDPEFCIRAMKLGYINGLFPIKYKSEIEWGGTRRSKSFMKEANRIHIRNRRYIYSKHKDFFQGK
jgi:glycosyltransferase involved in cell wall biosynthesis